MLLSQQPANSIRSSFAVVGGEMARQVRGALAPVYVEDLFVLSKTTRLTIPAASATYTAPVSRGSVATANIFDGKAIGFPSLFFAFAAFRALVARDSL